MSKQRQDKKQKTVPAPAAKEAFPTAQFVTVDDHTMGQRQCYHNALAKQLVEDGRATLPLAT